MNYNPGQFSTYKFLFPALINQTIYFLKNRRNNELKSFYARPSVIPFLCMAALLLLAGAIGFFFIHFITLEIIVDEKDIIIPVIQKIQGIPYVLGKYPPFPFLFYEVIIRLFLITGGNEEYIFALSRIINLMLYLTNIWLFYITVKPHLEFPWSFFAAVLFAFTPVIFFSGIYVKTESLLLLEILIFLICINHILINPQRSLWHIGAAISCGLAITTKYFIPLIFFYLVLLTQINYASNSNNIKDKFKLIIKNYNPWLFLLFLTATLIIIWPNLYELNSHFAFIKTFKNDIYFNPFPSFFRAVDESGSFPYGRYSSALWFVFPIGVGLLNYICAILGLITNSIPKKILWIWGGGFLFYLIYIFNMTLMRIFWMFTPVVPLIILSGVCFIKKMFFMGKSQIIFLGSRLVIILLLIFSFYQFSAVTIWLHGYYSVDLLKAVSKGNSIFIHSSESLILQGINNAEVDVFIENYKPQNVILLDSFFYNFCKYKKNEIFQRQCQFFNSIIAGKEGYQLVWKKSFDYPTQKLTFDPEASFTLYYLKRKLYMY